MSSSSYRSTSQRSSPFSSRNRVVAVDCSTVQSNGMALDRVSTWSVRSVAKRPARRSSSRVVRAPYSNRGMKIICIGTRPRVQRIWRWISGCGPDGRPSSATGMKSVSTTTPSACGRSSRGCWCVAGTAGSRSTRPAAGWPRCPRARGRAARRRRSRCRSAAGSTSRSRRRARPAPRCACRRSGRTRRESARGEASRRSLAPGRAPSSRSAIAQV